MGGKICPNMEFNPVSLQFDMGQHSLLEFQKHVPAFNFQNLNFFENNLSKNVRYKIFFTFASKANYLTLLQLKCGSEYLFALL